MRLLATHHITKEVRPDVFADNRVSSAMDSGRTIEELMEACVSYPFPKSLVLTWVYAAQMESTRARMELLHSWDSGPYAFLLFYEYEYDVCVTQHGRAV